MTIYEVVIQYDGRHERRRVADLDQLRAELMATHGHLNYFVVATYTPTEEFLADCKTVPSYHVSHGLPTRFDREEVV